MEIKEVYPHDFERVYGLLQLFENTRFKKEDFKKLFASYWQSSVNYKGLMVEEEGQLVGYLGLIFSDRVINGRPEVFCNLTTLIIHPSQRGKKLTHKIIAHLVQKGNYTFTAITPIPPLYNMYSQNGFVNLEDKRLLLWRKAVPNQPAEQYTENPQLIEKQLQGVDLRIFNDHQQFNCIHAVYMYNNQPVYMVFKQRVNQLRKYLDRRLYNYADALLRKLGSKGFLYKPTTTYELLYTNQPQLFAANARTIAGSFFALHQAKAIAVPAYPGEKFELKYPGISSFVHSRQMYLSSWVPPQYIDTLYSEIFVLDM